MSESTERFIGLTLLLSHYTFYVVKGGSLSVTQINNLVVEQEINDTQEI